MDWVEGWSFTSQRPSQRSEPNYGHCASAQRPPGWQPGVSVVGIEGLAAPLLDPASQAHQWGRNAPETFALTL